MPNGFPLNAAGRVNTDSVSPVAYFGGGLPYVNAAVDVLAITTTPPTVFNFNGFAEVGGRLSVLVQETDPATFYERAGFKFSLTGQLYLNFSLPIAKYVKGVPLAANGTICAVAYDPFGALIVFQSTGDGVNGSTTIPNLAVINPISALVCNGATSLSNVVSEYGTTSIRTGSALATDYAEGSANDVNLTLAGGMTLEWSQYVAGGNTGSLMGLSQAAGAAHVVLSTTFFIPSGGLLWVTGTFGGASPVFDTGAYVIPVNTWHKYAFVKDANGGGRFYIDGTRIGVTSSAGTPSTCRLHVGSRGGDGFSLAYTSNIRLTLAARYTGASYTVATAPFPLP